MYVPFVTTRSKPLFRRKGGGGGGKGGGGGSKGGSSSGGKSGGSSSSSGSSTSPKSVPLSGSAPAGKTSASAYGGGGGKAATIPSGQVFAGRSQGGGTRAQVFGTRAYGSGYPGITGRGVAGRGFPFYFWPVAWGGVGLGGAAYLADNEYGEPNNSSRPGGVMTQAAFVSNSTNTTFHVLSDNTTVTSLISSIDTNCSQYLSSSSSTSAQTFNPNATGAPEPAQAVQYYRASSVVLTLDGYNDTAALSSNTTLPDTPLPSGIDTNLLNCLNQTIGLAVPLISGAVSTDMLSGAPRTSVIGLVWLLWCLAYWLM